MELDIDFFKPKLQILFLFNILAQSKCHMFIYNCENSPCPASYMDLKIWYLKMISGF
jgi:hypothetical protein